MLISTKLSLLAVCNSFMLPKEQFLGDDLKPIMQGEIEDWFLYNPMESGCHDAREVISDLESTSCEELRSFMKQFFGFRKDHPDEKEEDYPQGLCYMIIPDKWKNLIDSLCRVATAIEAAVKTAPAIRIG